MSMRAKGGFLQQNWHWLALGAGLLTFALSLLHAMDEWSVDPQAEASLAAARFRTPAGSDGAKGVKPVDLDDYRRSAGEVRSPQALKSPSGREGSFLASEKRVHCKFCPGAILPGTKICPTCGKEQPEDEMKKAQTLDRDRDGLPDEWEQKYGIQGNKAEDATADSDGDLFTNAEEYEAKTDPKDPKSHPPYIDSLKLVEVKQKFMPFYFVNAYKTPSGLKFQFKDPSRVNEYDRGVYSVYEGQEIGKTGYVATKFEKIEDKKPMGGGMSKPVDASVATVTRKRDGKTVPMKVNVQGTPVDTQARLVFTRGAVTKEYVVVEGDKIDLNGEKYKVLKPKAEDKVEKKGAEVTLENYLSGKKHVLRALEQ